MKRINYLIIFVGIAVIVFSACNEKLDSTFESDVYEEQVEMPVISDNSIELYKNFKQFIADRDAGSLQQIITYLNEKDDNQLLTTRSFANKIDVFNNYLLENGIIEEQLSDFLEENPDEMTKVVELVCSSEFSDFYNKLKNISLTEENVFSSQIYDEVQLTHLEKTMLLLLLSSDMDIDSQTRSFKSCVKRYAKLTGIALKAIAISTVDPVAGAEYASGELGNMGSEYDC
ncbi:hypothetical protein [Proteiniphilum sp.]|uniref:hypothetical protein n=1 Tax=Proteiniphilum sp. TaxID=1926877 RepID=UPI003333A37B